MNTTVYLIRHSIPFKEHRGITNTNESILIENQKAPLSIKGENEARKFSKNREFKNIDAVWASNYVRTMSTAKYFAFRNNLKVNVDENLNERIHGINSWEELPKDFEINQFNDENYKIGFGESQKAVRERLYNTLMKIVDDNKGKRIIIVGHSTATAFLLGKWCETSYDKDYTFNNKKIFKGKWEYLQTFKLTFDGNNNLINIQNISKN